MDTYFRIGNLGETPLKAFDISEHNEENTLPIQESHNAKIGYRIDGITKSSGNIPTGNGKPGGQPLTFTVDELMTLYKASAASPFDGFPGDKSDMLSPPSLIFTNEETEKSQLLEEYMKLRMEYENEEAKWDKTVREKRMASFVMDMKSYSFLPDFVSYQPPNNLNIKVKTDIFRYPTLLANNLKMCLGLNISYPWETYTYLKEQGILSADGHLYLSIVLALSIYMRTKAYIEHASQTDQIQIHPTITDVSADKYYMPLNLFVLLGCLLIPVKQSINAGLTKLGSLAESESTKDEVALVMQDLEGLQTNHLQKAEVLYFVGQYDSAKEELSKATGQCLESTSCSTFLSAIQHLSDHPTDPENVNKYLELSSYLLYYTNNYNVALDYFNWFIDTEWGQKGFWELLSANCHKENGDFIVAKRLLKEAKESLGQYQATPAQASAKLINSAYRSDFNHRDASLCCRNIGHVYDTVSEYDEAIGCYEKALEIDKALYGNIAHPDIAKDYSRIADTYHILGEFALSIEYSNKSLTMYKAIYGADANHLDIATEYDYTGHVNRQIGNYAQSLKYHNKALAMYKAIHGVETDPHRTATCFKNVGAVYAKQGDYTLSLEYLCDSVAVFEAAGLCGPKASHDGISTTYNELGRAYSWLGDYASAIEFHDKAIDTQKAMYGADTNHAYIAISYTNTGLLYNKLGEYSMALEYLTKSVAMCEEVYGADTNNGLMAVNYGRMGFAHSGLGNHAIALEYLKKSLNVMEIEFGANCNHPFYVETLKKISEIYRTLGDDVLAAEYDIKATKIQ